MRFEDALKAMRNGEKVRRPTFCEDSYIVFIDGQLECLTPAGTCYTYNYKIRDDDLLAEDWEIVPDCPEVRIQTVVEEYYICPSCKNRITVLSSDDCRKYVYCETVVTRKRDDDNGSR